MKIDLVKLLDGVETYPNWSTQKTYKLKTSYDKKTVTVTYDCPSKRPKRSFNRYVNAEKDLFWMFGFLEGESLNSIKSSSYKRFIVTNNNPKRMKLVLDILERYNFVTRKNLPKNSIRIRYGQNLNKNALPDYWAKKLQVKKDKIYLAKKPDILKKSERGLCDIYISDVLLRRVLDAIKDYLFNSIKNNIK